LIERGTPFVFAVNDPQLVRREEYPAFVLCHKPIYLEEIADTLFGGHEPARLGLILFQEPTAKPKVNRCMAGGRPDDWRELPMSCDNSIREDQRRRDTEDVVALIPALRAFARTFCKDTSDADDLVQETLMKAIAKIDSYEHGTRLKSWLFTIMRNTFYNRVIVARREAPGAADCVSSQPVVGPTQEWAVRSRELTDIIGRLPDQQKEVVILVGLLGTSYKDAAEMCSCNIGTIKSRLNRSRLSLIADLEETSVESVFEHGRR
jgi:RNA polymerase sigma factor (sigma-70 family)